MTCSLGVFAKWPHPGTVKTRLGGPAGWNAAVARAFLLDTLARTAGLADRRVLAFAPPEARGPFAALVSGVVLTPQADGDLGARLHAFLAGELGGGAGKVVVVGTDSPTLPPEYIARAFAALDRADVVLGPATDGGYYLLGCRRAPPVFDGVAWSSPQVLGETVDRLGDPGWELALLPPWYDVDTPEGWAMLAGHARAMRRAGIDPGIPHTEALLAAGDAPRGAP
jgi:rSAM/selenodomain-associated transferase 1